MKDKFLIEYKFFGREKKKNSMFVKRRNREQEGTICAGSRVGAIEVIKDNFYVIGPICIRVKEIIPSQGVELVWNKKEKKPKKKKPKKKKSNKRKQSRKRRK